GLALLTAWAVWEGARRLAWRPEPALASVTLLACAAAIPVVWQRNRVWRDGLSLWQDAVAKGPGNGRAALNLGRELMARGKLAELLRNLPACWPRTRTTTARLTSAPWPWTGSDGRRKRGPFGKR